MNEIVGRSLKVLLVDDSERRKGGVANGLINAGIPVEPFASLEEVIEKPLPGVMFIHDDGDSAVAALARLMQTAIDIPLVAYSEDPTAEMIVAAVQRGALDYLSLPLDSANIKQRFARVAAADSPFRRVLLRRREARERIAPLSPRERQVLALVTEGATNKQIADDLVISPRTVEIHRANMLNKLGVSTTSAAVRIGVRAEINEGDSLLSPRDVRAV